MTTTPEITLEVPEIGSTFETIDQNTRRPITWIVDYSSEAGENVRKAYGWTHALGVSRPKGRRSYVVWVKLEDGKVVRHSNPTVAF